MSWTTELFLERQVKGRRFAPPSRPWAVILVLKALWRGIRRWRLRRQTEQRLDGLDDWMLKDIGLSRGEIGYRAREASRDLK